MKKLYYTLIVLAGLFIIGCREKYDLPVTSLPNSFLVVEGVLNAGQGPTTIHLTRTFKLDQNATVKTENNAQLTVEGKDNTTSFLVGTGNGNYVSGNLNLVANNEYRLRIKTTDGKVYLSDYVKAKITPAIDSITWKKADKGVQIYANTKDPSNAARYYRWDYEETWEIRSVFAPFVIYENGVIRNRVFPQEDVSVCWKNKSSTNILLANSIRLQSDIISEAPIALIPAADEKLFVRYSILVKQYALEPAAYNFFELMKKNSEEIGSLFSPQPSEIKGNLHCITNPDEFVIGFVTASTITEKRFFISYAQVAPWPNLTICEEVRFPNNPDSINYAVRTLGLMPYYHIVPPPADIYIFSKPFCVDCTTRGGSTIRPVFW
jgi:hypothetical protein